MSSVQSVDVLVIDDDSSFSEMTGMFLEQVNDSFEVVTCNSGEEGVEYFKANSVDCIVCDYEMPGLDGLEVLERVREISEVPFILFTGRGSEEVASEAFSIGATDYVQKSGKKSKYELLANRIMQYVEKQELYDESSRIREEKNRLLDRVNDAYISFNDSFEFMHLNQQGVELISEAATEDNLSYDDIIGEVLWDVVPGAVGTQFEREYVLALETGLDREFEAFYDDMGLWFEVRVFPSEDGLSVFVRDVTEQKRSEAAHKAESEVLVDLYGIASDSSLSSEERLSEAVRLGRDFFGVAFGFLTRIQNGQQEIVLAENIVENPGLDVGAVCPIEGSYCQHVLDQQEPLAVDSASDDSSVITRVAYERFELESYVSQKVFVDGELYGTLCFADFEGRAGGFSSAEMAVTELLAGWVGYEIERKQNRDRLEKQNKRLEAFAGIVSHDLRNPLSVAEGYLELEREERDSETLEKISKAHSRMDEMISELLEFARSAEELSDKSPVSIREIAEGSWENIQVGDSSLEVETDLVVEAECGKLLNVFENLFRNSIEHNDSPVTITVGDLPHRSGFYIEDDGVGVPVGVDVLSYQRDGRSRLGLLITQEIVEAHGWTIKQVDCERGARFEILFE